MKKFAIFYEATDSLSEFQQFIECETKEERTNLRIACGNVNATITALVNANLTTMIMTLTVIVVRQIANVHLGRLKFQWM